MTTPYVGEIRLFAFPRIPTGWFACDGSLKPIANNEVLFTLLGTTYGGDGVNTFAVPDLRGQVPLHMGTGPGLTNRPIGQRSGSESVTLLATQLPSHTHPFNVNSTLATANVPANNLLLTAPSNNDKMYTSNLTGLTAYALATTATGTTGGNLPHENTMPTLTASFCIAWAGIFPSQQ
ncbi:MULTISPECIES: phage tail protein [Janthinobacterium]|uniref:phage tail protein n=1 Tax=Janthinobacterium TaxID=29580 RepID=UPI00087E1349|nr:MULTISPECIES: tail fiber protein [Janthinobacterium]PHV23868.1 phage tail protein [Janthinobacterium sp. BJB446]QKY04704.1 phage tail protein [Janthinobacterium lividum]QKY10333.1 phage tail protein [Janthinobacterium lividum]SDG93541.1 Microcystin-dependent protein [Janthinobacterium sp. YR213]